MDKKSTAYFCSLLNDSEKQKIDYHVENALRVSPTDRWAWLTQMQELARIGLENRYRKSTVKKVS